MCIIVVTYVYFANISYENIVNKLYFAIWCEPLNPINLPFWWMMGVVINTKSDATKTQLCCS